MSRPRTPDATGGLISAFGEEPRSLALSYGLWCLSLVGFCGIHRLYNRKPVSGLIWLFTFGLCGIGQLIDLVLMPGMVEQANRQLRPLRGSGGASPPVDRQLLKLARLSGEGGFTLNDALIELDLPQHFNTRDLEQEIDKLLQSHLLDVGNDDRGRVVYREP